MANRSPKPTVVLDDTQLDGEGGPTPPPMLPDNQLGLADMQSPIESMVGEGGGDRGTPYYPPPNQVNEVETPEASGTKSEKPDGKPEENGEDENVEEKSQDEEEPPNFLSAAAADARLRRICTANSKGEYKVPLQVIDEFLDVKGGRVDLMKIFERCGHEKDRAHASKQSCDTKYKCL